MLRRFCSLTAICLAAAAPQIGRADLVLSANSDVLAGRDAFLSAGTATTQFDWSSLFLPNAHTTGQLGPTIVHDSVSVTVSGSTVNTIASVAQANALNFKNWVDAPGFNGPGDAAVADLAINGVESFDLIFGQGHRSLGLAIITGAGNDPSQFDNSGATFEFTAKDEDGVVIGQASFSLASGGTDQAWITLISDVEFYSIEVREVGATSIADQYFSNILTSVDSVAVPEPSAVVLCSLGMLGLLGRTRRRPGGAVAQKSA